MSEPTDPKTTNAATTDLTLSAALLAPLNSIFEAQIHSARAFLNFILQMGFKHRYTEEELEKKKAELQKSGNWDTATEENFEKLRTVAQLRNQREKLNLKGSLTATEENELNDANNQLRELGEDEDVYSATFNYRDGEGSSHQVSVPLLALVPVSPLAIKSADFEFNMSVNNTYENYQQMRGDTGTEENRPWYLISPKRIKGKIAPSDSKSESSAISIKIQVESAPIPQGLNTLLTSLTQSSRIDR